MSAAPTPRLARTRTWLLAFALPLSACAELPWGAGGLGVGRPVAGALVRVLDDDDLALAASRLDTELAERFGRVIRLRPGTLTPQAGVEVPLADLTLLLGQVSLTLPSTAPEPETGAARAPRELLTLRIELSGDPQAVTAQAWGSPCAATFSLGPATLELPVDLANDRLGRAQAIVTAAQARWLGPSPTVELQGCAPRALDAPTSNTGPRFAAAAAAPLQDTLSSALPAALGLELALGWSRVLGLDTLGAGLLRASLRAAASDALTGERLTLPFELGLEVEPHPCAGSAPLPEPGPPAPAPFGDGTAVAIGALEHALHAAWLAGISCGASAIGSIPEADRSLPLAELVDAWPALEALIAIDPDATARLAFWPGSLPSLVSDPELPDAVRLTAPGLTIDLTITLEGAAWRLATVEVDLHLSGQLVTDSNGFVHFDLLEAEPSFRSASAGLMPAPPHASASALVGPLVTALVESRPLLRLPAPLTPQRTTVWRVDADHVTLPGAAPAGNP